MALSTFVKHFEDLTLAIADGTATTPLSATANLDNGDLSLSGLTPDLREVVAYERKGSLQTLRLGKRVYPTGTFTCQFAEFSESSVGTVLDMIFGTAATPFAARVSTLGANAQVTAFDLTLTVEGTDYGDSADSTLTLNDVVFTSVDWSMGEPASLSLAFTVYGAVSGDLAISEG